MKVFSDGELIGETGAVRRSRAPVWGDQFVAHNVNNNTMIRFEAWEFDIFTWHDLVFSDTINLGDDVLGKQKSGQTLRLGEGRYEALFVRITVE